MVRIVIVGREVDPVLCAEGSNADAVKRKVIAVYGPGLLMRDGVLVDTETLTGNYEFHITETRKRRWENLNSVLDNNSNSKKAEDLMSTPTADDAITERRKRRWEKLNSVLDNSDSKKAQLREEDDNEFMVPSYVLWNQMAKHFPLIKVGSVGTSSNGGLSEDRLASLHNYLLCASTSFPIISGAKRLHFIAPIIIIACSHFNGDVQILPDEDIEGNRVRDRRHFAFVLKRGSKGVCIAEAFC